MGDKIYVYRGWIIVTGNGEDDSLLGLGTEDHRRSYILAEKVYEDVQYADTVSVRYFITDIPVSADDLEDELASVATGDADINYGMHYSDITGYLWTDEDLVIGGHDLVRELYSHMGKFLHLEVTAHAA